MTRNRFYSITVVFIIAIAALLVLSNRYSLVTVSDQAVDRIVMKTLTALPDVDYGDEVDVLRTRITDLQATITRQAELLEQ